MTVLLVEDDQKIRARLALVMRASGLEVEEAGTIAGALARIGEPGLETIVLDLRLPNGHGRRVIEELKKVRNDVPIVILSAFPDEVLHEWPVTAILKKPTKPVDLKAAVASARMNADALKSLRRSTNKLRHLSDSE